MDLEQLKARIKANKEKIKEEVVISPFSSYLNYYNFTQGIDKIPTYLIYYCYKRYMEKILVDYIPLKTSGFFRVFSKSFKSVRWGKQRYYLLDKGLLKNITEEIEFESKMYKKRQRVSKRSNGKPIYKWDRGSRRKGSNKTTRSS